MTKQAFNDVEYNGNQPQQSTDLRLLWGGLLIIAGLLFLVQNLGWFDFLGFVPRALWSLIWAGIFGAAGMAFLAGLVLTGRRNWWMAIPGFTLLGLSGTIVASDILPFIPFEGSIFLGSIGLGFLTVYVMNRDMWWAVIPGGVLGTLALVAAVDEFNVGDLSGAIFFLGLGLTFGLVAMLPTPKGRMTWALIPAGVMLVMSMVVLTSAYGLFNLLWPLILVGVGALILFRNLIQGRSS
ncbi:MAG: hypothetical protein KF893_24045 [Caldilineaceae bacterium]|nr:hypothetical protein [Caldilineaceae bacterium]